MRSETEILFDALARSSLRSGFSLGARERKYLQDRGMSVMRAHAHDFITRRLAPAQPANDGKQTPMKNHPVFIAQHATATCCRGCLEKWHGIPKGQALTAEQIDYIASVITEWLARQGDSGQAVSTDLSSRPGVPRPNDRLNQQTGKDQSRGEEIR